MTITNGYCTLAEFKAWDIVRGGGTISTDTADDAVLEQLIEGVSRWFDTQTGRRFYKNATDEVRYFSACESNQLHVGDMAAAPTTVSVDYSGTRSYTDLLGTDWEVGPENAALDGRPYTVLYIAPLSNAYFAGWRRGVKITGKFGFPAVPMDIKDACMATVKNVKASRAGQSSAGRIDVTASGVVIRPEDVPSWVNKLLESYRNPL